MRFLGTSAVVTAVLISLVGCTEVGAPTSESPDLSVFGAVQKSPDEYQLTRKIVCEVPGEGQLVLIYSTCLYHNGRVIRELGAVSRPTFPQIEILDCRFPDGSIIGTTVDRCAEAGGQLQTLDATSAAKD